MLIQILIPVGFILVTILSEQAGSRSFQNLPALPITLQSYLQTVTVLETNPTADPNSWERR